MWGGWAHEGLQVLGIAAGRHPAQITILVFGNLLRPAAGSRSSHEGTTILTGGIPVPHPHAAHLLYAMRRAVQLLTLVVQGIQGVLPHLHRVCGHLRSAAAAYVPG